MTDEETLCSKDVEVINELGIHARSAAKIARAAAEAGGEIWLIKEGERADAKSIIDMLTLGSPMGSRLTVEISSPADAGVLQTICRLFETGFEE
jgi:phosphocarrier protein